MAQTPAIFKQKGDLIDHTPALAVAAGQVIEISNIPYVAPVAIPAGKKGTLAATGIFAVPKTSDTFTPGAAVYWNASGTPVSGDASSGAADNATGNFMGIAVESDEYGDVTYGAATAAAAYVLCQLQPMKRVPTDPLSTTGISAADASLDIAGLTAAQGGAVAIVGGVSETAGNAGGAVSLTGGVGGATGAGGAVAVTGGAGGSSSGTGGAVTITGGAGKAGNANGGAVSITGGAKNGSGANGAVNIGADKATVVTVGYASGKLYLVGLPTSDPMSANQVWVNSNVLTLSAGG